MSAREHIARLYEGDEPGARRFRYALLVFDLFTVLFFVATTFLHGHPRWMLVADGVIGILVGVDLAARLLLAPARLQFLARPATIVDIVVVLSLLAPAFTESFAFLRVLRALRLFRSYHVLAELRSGFVFFARNEEVIHAVLNLVVFIFVVSALVFVLQVRVNPAVSNYVDALYFTVTTLTTTGFGDITLVGGSGRLLSIAIMIVGISLFLRLLQSIFRPRRVRYECPGCGLLRHDPDAVHCKHCGALLHIITEGE